MVFVRSGGMDVREAIAVVQSGRSLGEGPTEAVFTDLLSGQLAEEDITALLAAIQGRRSVGADGDFAGATVEELVGAARVMRRHVTRVPFEAAAGEVVIDTCGTGGAAKTFNVSTAAAIVLAAARTDSRTAGVRRVVVAKHGNRSRTRRGSAEVLAALGVNVDATIEVQARCLRECGVCFCFAIHHHPAMRFAAGPRRAVAGPTIFNVLGPLTNPAGAMHQVIGVYERSLVDRVARALAGLGASGAMVVHGLDPEGGMDELTVTAASVAGTARDGVVSVGKIDPVSLGLGVHPREPLIASSVERSAAMVRAAISKGADDGAGRIVRLNAAAGLVVCGASAGWREALEVAQEAVESGRALAVLGDLSRLSREGA